MAGKSCRRTSCYRGYFLRFFFVVFFFFLVEPADFFFRLVEPADFFFRLVEPVVFFFRLVVVGPADFFRLVAVELVGFFFADFVFVRPNAASQPSAYFVVEPVRRILTGRYPLLQGTKSFCNVADLLSPLNDFPNRPPCARQEVHA